MTWSSRTGSTLLPFVVGTIAAFLVTTRAATAQSGINGWGGARFDSRWNEGPYVQLAAGGLHTVALRADGKVVAFGATIPPPALPPGLLYVEVAASVYHSVARRSDGSVVAWGDNFDGACNVPPLPPGLTYVEIAAGGGLGDNESLSHTVARRSDGSVVAWGDNTFGQCNVPALPPGLTYVEIAAGFGHTLARRSDGSVVAWGSNSAGECNVPALPAGLTYVEITAGGYLIWWQGVIRGLSYARRSDGSIVAWGAGAGAPALPSGLTYVAVNTGGNHTVARRSDGSIVAWGANSDGQCQVPEPPAGLTYVEVAAGGRDFSHGNTVALLSDGSMRAWGDNRAFQCNVPALPSGVTYVEIDAFEGHTVARLSDGSIVVLGGPMGQVTVPELPSGLKYVEVDVGIGHYIARRSDGSVVAWGINDHGQCNVPSLPSGLTYVEVDAGSSHSIARRSDGSVVAWGLNNNGQCDVPALPPGLTYVEIAGGGTIGDMGGHTVARRSDGSIVAWGDNTYGQCNVPPGSTFLEVAAGGYHTIWRPSGWTTIVGIAAGYEHDLYVRDDGSAYGVGSNFDGQCTVPALPSGLRYVEVAAGYNHSVGRFEGCPTCELPFCVGDGAGWSVSCPCGNYGADGHGCENSGSTGGALLSAQGSVEPDQVELGASSVLPLSLCIFFQGRSVLGTPIPFGDGVRCIGGTLDRIGVKTAFTSSVRYPEVGDPPISARSAALGDLIRPGTYRYYQVYYRDPDPAFCNPAPATFNATNAVMVAW